MSRRAEPGDPRSTETVRWLAVSLPAPPPGEAILLVEALRALGARSVERDGDGLVAMFTPSTEPGDDNDGGGDVIHELIVDVGLAVRSSTSMGQVTPRWRWLEREEWTARWGAGHPARRVSDRLVVIVGDEVYAPAASTRVIRLEPSTAFGTAEHPTTRACLRLLDAAVADGDRVLDVGAGSGVLAIAAAALGASYALALESDAVACVSIRRNARSNGVGDRVRVREVSVGPETFDDDLEFDGIVANIGAAVLRPLIPALARAINGSGWIILSGMIPGERDGVLADARSIGLVPTDEAVEEGWWTVRLARNVGAGGPGL